MRELTKEKNHKTHEEKPTTKKRREKKRRERCRRERVITKQKIKPKNRVKFIGKQR